MLLITTGELYWDLFIGAIGMGFFLYGRKRPDMIAVITGLILIIYPYFTSTIGWNIGIGVGIIAIYLFMKHVIQI